MLDRAAVQRWLDAYVEAWKSYDRTEIGNLFTEDVTYYYSPYSQPVRGREAVVASWLEEDRRDASGTYDGHYEPLAVDGDVAVTHGRSRYFREDGITPTTEYDNIFVLRFDGDGRCSEYREWWMERPKDKAQGS